MDDQQTIILKLADLDNQLKIVNLAELLSLKLPPRELILHPWLPRAGLCMVHAYRGVGKTHISLGIAYAVAKGGSFLGWYAEKPRNVLYIDGEMPAVTLQERLANIVKMNQDIHIPGQLRIITPDLQEFGMPDLATIEGQEIINHYITDDIDLVIVDNLSSLAPSIKENDSADWAMMQTWVLALRRRGKSVLLVHHSGKGGKQRGTSKREDVLDTVIYLERPDDYEANHGARFIVRYEKNRSFFGDDANPFICQLTSNSERILSWKTEPLEESTRERIVSLAKNGLSQKCIRDEVGVSKGTVSKYLKDARQQGKL